MRRGDVFFADLGPATGAEQAYQRPVLLYQYTRLLRATATAVIIPFTTNMRLMELPSCVVVPAGEGNLDKNSVAICHQIRALDKARLQYRIGTLPTERVEIIDDVVLQVLGVDPP